jgi:predicted nucleic acid-binding protein
VSQVFVDTSAILALLNPKDELHPRARRAFDALRAGRAGLVTTSYVLVEIYALLGRRMGLGAVRACRVDLAPLFEVVWVDESIHEEALDLLLDQERGLSLVDAASFVVMRRLRLDRAFAFDRHFEEEGFARPG